MPKGIFEEYLSGGAGAFFDGHFHQAQDRERALLRAVRPLAPSVADAIETQNARLAASPAREQHLSALRRGAAAVVTGQQVGLFLGPLFTLYKAASAVRVARALTAESGQTVVPIFWLQTEDHDLPEIAQCHAPCARGAPLTLRVPASTEDRISIGHRSLPAEVATCLTQLHAELAHLPHATEHLRRLERSYVPGTKWSDAFATCLAELFAPDGLVIVDPRDERIARAAAPVHRRALEEAMRISELLSEHRQELENAGFVPAVHLRPGAPLSFFHPHGPAGPRYRLERAANGFVEVGGDGTHSYAELCTALEADPLCFSTSALLRPLLQDVLLPTAAYVAGPGEVAYLAQVAPLYAAYEVPMPIVVPRARLRILEHKTLRLMQRLGVNADDAQRSEESLLAALANGAREIPDRALLERTLLDPLGEAMTEIRARLEESGIVDCGHAFDKTRASIQAAVAKLAEKIERAALHRDQDLVDDVRRLRWSLYPNGLPQERYYGLSYFAARYGERELVERVLAAIDPFDPSPKDLSLAEVDSNPLSRAEAEEDPNGICRR